MLRIAEQNKHENFPRNDQYWRILTCLHFAMFWSFWSVLTFDDRLQIADESSWERQRLPHQRYIQVYFWRTRVDYMITALQLFNFKNDFSAIINIQTLKYVFSWSPNDFQSIRFIKQLRIWIIIICRLTSWLNFNFYFFN